jgi:hypothetical protein
MRDCLLECSARTDLAVRIDLHEFDLRSSAALGPVPSTTPAAPRRRRPARAPLASLVLLVLLTLGLTAGQGATAVGDQVALKVVLYKEGWPVRACLVTHGRAMSCMRRHADRA